MLRERSALSPRSVDLECPDPDQYNMVLQVMNDLRGMLTRDLGRLDRFLSILRVRHVPPIENIFAEDRTIWRTFEAFFGQVYFGPNSESRSNSDNIFGVQRVQKVRDLVNTVLAWIANPDLGHVEIWCSDDFLSLTDPFGRALPDDFEEGRYVFDTRYFDLPSNPGKWIEGSKCTTADRPIDAFTYDMPPEMWNRGESVIVLCSAVDWAMAYKVGGADKLYSVARTKSYPSSSSQDSRQLAWLQSFPHCAILHELTH